VKAQRLDVRNAMRAANPADDSSRAPRGIPHGALPVVIGVMITVSFVAATASSWV